MTASESAQRWRRLSALFERAIDLQGPARDDLISSECRDDLALRADLERMLAADEVVSGIDQGIGALIDAADLDAAGFGMAGDRDSTEAEDSLGSHLGHWLLERVLGQGGMGTVYAARRDDRDSGQHAAVKRLHRRWDGSLQAQRFLQERRILAALSHPNLPQLIDHGTDGDGRPWFALELIDGRPLTDWANTHRLDLRQRLELFMRVCGAVQHAHTRFVVHRDLKPANILVDGEGHPKVLDFGVAKRTDEALGNTRDGALVGFTPQYAAPEQISGGVISAATDVYALGVVLYQLLTGRLPYTFDAADLHAVAATITTRPAGRLEHGIGVGEPGEIGERLQQRDTNLRTFRRFVRGDLSRIVQTALAKEPERRYPSVQAFSDDLERFLAGRPVAVSGDSLGYRGRKFVRRNAAAVVVAALLTTGLLGTTAFALHSAGQERQQRDAALAEVRRGNAIREYVQLMFRSAAERTGTERPTAQDVLKSGVDRLFSEFDTEPAAARPVAIMLAELYMELGDWEGAAPLLERVLTSPGIATDPDTQAKAQHYLAQAAYNRGEMARAGDLLRSAQATWGQQPLRYARELNESRISQAKLERNAGDGLRAIATLQAMLAERPGLVGGQDREYAVAQSTLSAFLLDTGAYEEADQHARAAIATFEHLGMGRTSQSIVAMNNLAASLTQRDLDPEAEAILRRLVLLYRELYGTSSVNLALMQANLADSLRKQGRTAEAIPLLEDARPMAMATSGEGSAATLHVSLALADAYLDAGRIDAGEALLDTTFPIVLADLGAQHRLAGVGYRVRANLQANRGDRKAATADYDAAQAVFLQLGPAGKPLLARLAQKRRKAGL